MTATQVVASVYQVTPHIRLAQGSQSVQHRGQKRHFGATFLYINEK